MLLRNSNNNREQPTSALRRSPRLLPKNHTEVECPITPIPRSRTQRFTVSDHSSPCSTLKAPSNKTRKRYSTEVPKKLEGSHIRPRNSVNSSTGSRRSARVEGFGCLRRSPRFSREGNFTDGCVKRVSQVKENPRNSSDVGKAEKGKFDKKVTRSCTRKNTSKQLEKIEWGRTNGAVGVRCASSKLLGKQASVGVEKTVANFGPIGSGEQVKTKLEKRTTRSSVDVEGARERKEREIDEVKELSGVKRKRNQADDCHENVQGWTQDQEMALQNAYLAAKPSPHFWKKVAKLVPGKSAQDCFDKVHSDHVTPPQPRPRSRAKTKSSPSLSVSASDLLKTAEPKIRRLSTRQRNHLAQKLVRQLHHKHYHVDKDHEADLFSVLEPTFDQSTQGLTMSTPERVQEKAGFHKKCRERSSSARKRHLSRLGGSFGATLVSPPVLKQVKNKAMHERYLDQLHCREAKRKTAFTRTTKFISVKEGKMESPIRNADAIKAAKNALVFDARDVINQFQHLNACDISNSSDVDDECVDSDDEEGEIQL